MSTEISKIYEGGTPKEGMQGQLQKLTNDTRKTHKVYDMHYPAWGLGLMGFAPIAESGNIVAEAQITVPPGDKPKNGDVLVIPLKDGKSVVGMIFDPESLPGDYIGDGFKVHVVQYNRGQAIGHEFITKGQDACRGGRG